MASVQDAIAAARAAKEPVEVKYGGWVVRVKPPMQWRQSAMAALRAGDFNGWAHGTFVNDLHVETDKAGDEKTVGCDDAQTFIDADLTFEQVAEFMDAYVEAAGQAPGE